MKVLRFTASWCRPCQALGPLIDSMVVNADVDLEVIDVDQRPELATKWDIRSVPTVILFDDHDTPIFRGVGVNAIPELEATLSQR